MTHTLKLGTLLIVLVAITSVAFIRPGEVKAFVIKGAIDGNADGNMVYLKSAEKKGGIIDSTVISNGRFQFNGKVEYPRLYNIVIVKNDKPVAPGRPVYQPVIPVFVENANIEINAVLDSIALEDYIYYGSYNYNTVTIKGSSSNDRYMSFLDQYGPLAKKRSDIFMNEYIPYLNPVKGKQKGPVSEGIKIVTKIDKAAAQRDAYVMRFIRDNNNNMVGLYVAKDKLSAFSVTQIDEIISSLSPKLMQSEAGKILLEEAQKVKKTAQGAPYADFSFKDDQGNSVNLSDYLGKGKYVLLEFWASWCGPCRADLPHLKEVYERYHPKGFEVISISMDDDKAKWLKAVDEEKMKWLQVSDLKAFQGDLSKLYNFTGIPTCVLISPDGKIVTRNMRGSWMDKKLIELYGNQFGNKY